MPSTGPVSRAPGEQPDPPATSGLTIRRRPVVAWLGGITGFLVVAGLAVVVLRQATGHPSMYDLLPMFDVDDEANLPTVFSAALLAFAMWILFAISSIEAAAGRRRLVRYWRVLALLFGYLTLDELAGIHELLIRPLRELFGFNGALYYAWVVLAIPAAAIFAVAYIRFLLALPREIAVRMVLAGAIYTGGAIGMEMIGAMRVQVHGNDMIYGLITVSEEAMEMAGIVVFIDTLLRYLVATAGDTRWSLRFR